MKTPQFEHQKIGTDALVKNPFFALFDEMGAGKSKQVVDAACQLAEQGKIDTVVIVAPASVRCVWIDFEIGEIQKHAWWPSSVWEFHSKMRKIWENGTTGLSWLITNYEFLRGEKHLIDLCAKLNNRKTLLVLDESSYVKNRTAKQTKAILKLRSHCARAVLLNGTPITQSPLDLWSQMQILSPHILQKDFHDFYNFRANYCETRTQRFGGRRSFQQIVSYRRLDNLAKRVAPYVLRRLKQDCLDLPEKLYTVREVALEAKTWALHKELKKDFLVSLSKDDVQLEPNAAVRIMRLAQLTSGILGGKENHVESIIKTGEGDRAVYDLDIQPQIIRDISDEKLQWAVQYLTEECTARAVIVWTRWRRERERLAGQLRGGKFPLVVQELYGGQNATARNNAVQFFSSMELSSYRRVLIAQQHAGGHGLNLIAATEAIYLSNDFSLGMRLQSEDRCHRPGQKHAVTYVDVLATGPKGEHTVDHAIVKALREKRDVAALTTEHWRKELSDE